MKKGTIQVIESFYMPELNRYRTIRIYLPQDYNESCWRKRFPGMMNWLFRS